MHTVEVKEQKIKNAGNLEFSVDFEAPQVDDIQELILYYGGEKEVVERNNKAIARAAVQMPKLRLSKTTATNLDELKDVIAKEQENAKAYKPEAGGGISKNDAKSGVDRLASLAEKDQDVFNQMTGPEALEFIKTGKLPERLQKAA